VRSWPVRVTVSHGLEAVEVDVGVAAAC
jgi:hypothetical protein